MKWLFIEAPIKRCISTKNNGSSCDIYHSVPLRKNIMKVHNKLSSYTVCLDKTYTDNEVIIKKTKIFDTFTRFLYKKKYDDQQYVLIDNVFLN